MQQTPLVSIIIPAYNYANFISETLQSIQQQTYINWEAIVVDDGSTDETQRVVNTFVASDKRIKYIYQTNKGLPAARNTGIKASEGIYIQFLDADDLLSEMKLEVQVKYMQENPNSDISYTNAHYFKNPDKNIFYTDINLNKNAWMPKLNGSGKIILEKLIEFNIMPVNSALIKRDLFNTVGYQNEELKSHEDWEYWLRCALAGATFNFVKVENAYALIRVHYTSMSQKNANMLKSRIQLRSKLKMYINNSLINPELKYTLYQLNYIYNKRLQKEFIAQHALLNFKELKAIYDEYGIFVFFKFYFSAINKIRKQIIRGWYNFIY